MGASDLVREYGNLATLERRGPLGPQLLLRIAVLEDAVGVYRRLSARHGRAGRKQCDEVELWFLSRERSYPFSYLSICEALDIDADRLLRRLGIRQARIDRFETGSD